MFYAASATVHEILCSCGGGSEEGGPRSQGRSSGGFPDCVFSPVHCVFLCACETRARGGRVQVGDVIMEVSAVTLKAGKEGEYEAEGYGQVPFDNFEKSMMSCVGQSFDTVMSAISSNNPRWGYTTIDLIILRPDEE